MPPQARRDGGIGEGELSYPGPRDVCGAPPSLRNIKYTRMHHFKKKNAKNFSPEKPRKDVWGPARMFSRALLWL